MSNVLAPMPNMSALAGVADKTAAVSMKATVRLNLESIVFTLLWRPNATNPMRPTQGMNRLVGSGTGALSRTSQPTGKLCPLSLPIGIDAGEAITASTACPGKQRTPIFPPMSQTPGYQRFFAELKRRHVFRIAAVYGGVGFVIMQAADVFIPALHLPPWIMSAVAFLVILGFPIAVLIAWAFELTPEGLKKTADATAGELEEIAAAPAGNRWPIGLAALVGLILIALSGWWLATGRIRGTGTYDSIAVLPFANLSDNQDLEYFSDGLSEELLNALAGVEDLRVAARTSSFAFKGTNADIRTIADSLGVETVLEGSVRRSGDQVRITVQLIDAEHGFHLWSNEYDRGLDDVFATQDEIASAVTAALIPRLKAEDIPTTRGGTKDVVAYDEYLKGREKWRTRDVEALKEAVEHFRMAVDLDPEFALAWSGLADAVDALVWRDIESAGLLQEGRLAALRALTLDPEMAEGWVWPGSWQRSSTTTTTLESRRCGGPCFSGLRLPTQTSSSQACLPTWVA